MMVGDETLPIENTSGASLLQLQYATEHCYEEGQYLRTTFLVACSEKKESNYSTLSTFGGRLYCFRHVYGLTTTSAMCRDRRAEKLRKTSSDSHCGSNFGNGRTLKKK